MGSGTVVRSYKKIHKYVLKFLGKVVGRAVEPYFLGRRAHGAGTVWRRHADGVG